MPDIVYVAAL